MGSRNTGIQCYVKFLLSIESMINIYFISYFSCYLIIIDLMFTKTITQYQIIIRNKMREPNSFFYTHTHTHQDMYLPIVSYKQVFKVSTSSLAISAPVIIPH